MRSVHPVAVAAVLAVVSLVGSAARGNAPTPFLDVKNKVGSTSTEKASLISEGGDRYLVVVRDDKARYHVIEATAAEGVVDPGRLGRPVRVEAKVIERRTPEGRASVIRLRILSVK